MAEIQKNQGASTTKTTTTTTNSSTRSTESELAQSVSSSTVVTNVALHPYQSEPQKKMTPVLPAPTQCSYTPCYCEENVWKLCDRIRTDYPVEIDYCYVAFISNPHRRVPMWRQKSGKNEEKLALWDYHVILFYNPDERCVVYDMDSDLPFPTHFHKYVTETFRTEKILQADYHRFFRVISASKFLTIFSSDRRHMMREDGTWIKPPPSYPPICPTGVSNMEQFLDMTSKTDSGFGELYNLMELVVRFYKRS